MTRLSNAISRESLRSVHYVLVNIVSGVIKA